MSGSSAAAAAAADAASSGVLKGTIARLEAIEDRIISLLDVASETAANLAGGEPAKLAETAGLAQRFAEILNDVQVKLTAEIVGR